MAKRTDKAGLELAFSEAVGALSALQCRVLEALYEQALVGRSLSVHDAAWVLRLPYSLVASELFRAMTALKRWETPDPEDALKQERAEFPPEKSARTLGSRSSRLGFYYCLSQADEGIFQDAAGPLILQGT